MANFAQRLKELRQKNNLTQQELANILGIYQGSYANWENGKREPNLENIVKLSNIFCVTTDELLGQIKK